MTLATAPTLPAPCRHLLSDPTQRIPDVLPGLTITVGSGPSDLYNALGLPTGKTGPTPCLNADGNHKGNTYMCPPGAIYSIPMVMPPTGGLPTDRSNYTRIQSSAPSLPARGTKVGPQHAAALFKVIFSGETGGGGKILIPNDSAGWHFIGMEMASPTPESMGFGFIFMRGRRVCLERCYLHGSYQAGGLVRCMYVSAYDGFPGEFAEDLQIWDSSITGAYATRTSNSDSQVIYYQRAQRCHIENTLLSGGTETVMISDQFSATSSFDFTFKRVHFLLPDEMFHWTLGSGLDFRPDLPDRALGDLNPGWRGEDYIIKNHLESKGVSRLLVDGCLLENAYQSGAFLINTQAFNTEDVLFQYNIIKNTCAATTINLQASGRPEQGVNHRVKLSHNLYLNCIITGFYLGWEATDTWIEHNTVVPMTGAQGTGTTIANHPVIYAQGAAGEQNFARFTFKNNIVGWPQQHIGWSGSAGSLATAFFEREWAKNAIINTTTPEPFGEPSFLPYATAAAMVNQTTGALNSGSPLIGFATDGTDLGVNFTDLALHQAAPVEEPPNPYAPALPIPVTHLMSSGSRIPDTLGGQTYTVGSGAGDLATWLGLPTGKTGATPCLNADGTHKGNTYLCPAGATYNSVTLPPTTGTSATNYTCIKSNSPTLPAFGTRIAPSDVAKLFTIQATSPICLTIPRGSNGWRIIGLHVTQPAPANTNEGLIWVEGDRVCLERIYLHSHPNNRDIVRGIQVSCSVGGFWEEDFQLWDSYLTDIRVLEGAPTYNQAYCTGLHFRLARRSHVENCYIEAGTAQKIHISDQSWGQQATDITIQKNTLFHSPTWFQYLQEYEAHDRGGTLNPAWDNFSYAMERTITIEFAQRVLIQGNTVQNTWRYAPLVMATSTGFNIEDVTIQHNRFENQIFGMTIRDDSGAGGQCKRIKVYNNLFTNIDACPIRVAKYCEDLWVEHNTYVPVPGGVPNGFLSSFLVVLGAGYDVAPRFILKRNASGFGDGAVFAEGPFAQVMATRIWAENALCGIFGSGTQGLGGLVGFDSFATAGVDPTTGVLAFNSPLKVGQAGYFGTDGKNLGVDHTLLGTITGSTGTPPVANFTATQTPDTLTVQFLDTSA